MTPEQRHQEITTQLNAAFQPSHLVVRDDSEHHKGHAGHGGHGGAGHYHVTIVSDKFQEMTQIEQHRAVYNALSNLMHKEIHALSIQASSIADKNTVK